MRRRIWFGRPDDPGSGRGRDSRREGVCDCRRLHEDLCLLFWMQAEQERVQGGQLGGTRALDCAAARRRQGLGGSSSEIQGQERNEVRSAPAMNRLAGLLPFNADETIASYCSRLAAACGYRHARSFGADLGFRFQGLVVGDEADVQTFADVLGTSVASLFPGTVVTRNRMTTVLGQQLSKTLVERQRLRFCPFCVQEDEKHMEGRRGFRAYGRVLWLVTPIRMCKRHGVGLVTSGHNPASAFVHDFAANLSVEKENIQELRSDAAPWESDNLQDYAEARFAGLNTGAAWLDTLPFYVAIRLCEMVGAAERHGIRFRMATIDQREWSACAGTGYDLLRGGESGLRELLATQLQRFHHGKGPPGGRALFGRIYEWLAHETDDEGYEPVRMIMRDVAISNLPLGPGDEFLGPVTERRLHSVWSASAEFGMHVKRLQKLVVNGDLVPVEDQARTPDRILLPADILERLAVEARESLDIHEAQDHLGVNERQLAALVKRGILTPHGGNCFDAQVPVYRRFIRSDLDAFLGSLQAVVTCEDDTRLSDIGAVSRKFNRAFEEIVQLVLTGELKTVAWAVDNIGTAAVRIDPEEIKERLLREGHDCFTFRDLEKMIPVSYRIIQALVGDGHLATVSRRSPVKRTWHTVVKPDVFSAFRREFVPLSNLSVIRGWSSRKLRLHLDQAGFEPAFTSGNMPFYRRAEVLHLFPSE
ncbi:hypothetical protein E0H63_36115 [Rhizobium leguminosarum bv. viciae]|nr:hypothetical protein E0H63_36115 [Rhizobium leguminosarum bv. viciae]